MSYLVVVTCLVSFFLKMRIIFLSFFAFQFWTYCSCQLTCFEQGQCLLSHVLGTSLAEVVNDCLIDCKGNLTTTLTIQLFIELIF
jgi:hypothetical protein